jgi:hypothetical protein
MGGEIGGPMAGQGSGGQKTGEETVFNESDATPSWVTTARGQGDPFGGNPNFEPAWLPGNMPNNTMPGDVGQPPWAGSGYGPQGYNAAQDPWANWAFPQTGPDQGFNPMAYHAGFEHRQDQ